MTRLLWIAFYALISVNGILVGAHWISNSFTGRGIDESVLYQLVYGFDGVNFSLFIEAITVGVVSATAILIGLWLLHRKHLRHRMSLRWLAAAVLALVSSLLLNPAGAQLYSVVRSAVASDGQESIVHLSNGQVLALESLYGTRPIKVDGAQKPRNLVYIYAEGLDQAFFDGQTFGNLMPHLNELSNDAINFRAVLAPPGTTWTMGGVVASQCGVPLAAPQGQGNEFGRYSSFLPGATCLGDELTRLGYDLRFVQGASLDFAGKGKFLSAHGFGTVLGLHELAKPDETLSGWGRYDTHTFAEALDQFRNASAADKPFGLFLLTVDTHPPAGFPSPECEPAGSRPQMIATLSCSDRMLAQFIRTILEEDRDGNTVVVLTSDHPMMMNEIPAGKFPTIRHNTFSIWNSVRDADAETTDRRASTFDIGATVAQAMGLDAGRIGMGVSLFDAAPTLAELTGNPEQLDTTIQAWMPFYRRLWNDAEPGRDPIVLASDSARVRLGRQEIDLPVMFDIDMSSKSQGISLTSVVPSFAQSVQMGNRPALFDDCASTNRITGSPIVDKEGLCAIYFDEARSLHIQPLAAGDQVSLKTDERWQVTGEISNHAVERLSYLAQHGAYPENHHRVAFPHDVRLKSAGFNANTHSYADNGVAVQTLYARGVTVLHISTTGAVEQIGTVDTCGLPVAGASIEKLIAAAAGRDGAVVLAVADSAFCGHPIDWALGELELPLLRSIGIREPYVAIIQGHDIREFKATADRVVLVDLDADDGTSSTAGH